MMITHDERVIEGKIYRVACRWANKTYAIIELLCDDPSTVNPIFSGFQRVCWDGSVIHPLWCEEKYYAQVVVRINDNVWDKIIHRTFDDRLKSAQRKLWRVTEKDNNEYRRVDDEKFPDNQAEKY